MLEIAALRYGTFDMAVIADGSDVDDEPLTGPGAAPEAAPAAEELPAQPEASR